MRGNLVKREPARIEHWEKIGLYKKIQKLRENSPKFVLHDGPPFTNGDVHIGTALNKILKDVILRYKSMRGFTTPYIPGWDCHGLPIEHKVVKQLRKDKRTLDIPQLREECAAFSESFIEKQRAQFVRLGVLADWKNEYKTKKPAYEADILRTFAAFIERGLVYRSKKPVYWSIPCATALAEAEIEWQSRKYLLCFPLSTASIFAVEQTAARLRYLRTPLLTEYTILRDEMTYTDDTGTTRTCDVVLHRLPEGRPLSVCAAEFDAESLRSALDKLEAGLSELGFSHNNLKPGNLYVTSDGRLIPVRYHFARFGEGHDAEGFERLRQFVREQGGKGQMLCDAEPSRYTTLPEFPGHLFVGEMSDQLVRVEDETGYGFVDTENRPVIAPQFVWAADFREGRAEVQTAQGMGLIDKRGHYVIEPRYEIVDYNPYTGCSRIRSEGLWALADYNGRIVGGFTPRYIEENEYVEA